MVMLGYTIVYVPDVPAALAFYERAFGLSRRFVDESGNYGELETGAVTLAFSQDDFAHGLTGVEHQGNAADGPAGGFELVLLTDDVAAAVEAARIAGATVVSPPAEMPWGQTVAYVRDLNGVLVELATPVGATDGE